VEERLEGSFITKEYFTVCDDFLTTLNMKRTANLIEIIGTSDAMEIIVNLKCEMDFEAHSLIGLGRRMPEITRLEKQGALSLKEMIAARVEELVPENTHHHCDVEKLRQVCRCVAEDEIYDAISVETEQLEILLEDKSIETAKNY
jgi:hypothetical protein